MMKCLASTAVAKPLTTPDSASVEGGGGAKSRLLDALTSDEHAAATLTWTGVSSGLPFAAFS